MKKMIKKVVQENRNAIGQIIQFVYGEDGVDPAKSDHGKAMNMDVIFEKILSQRRVEE